MVPKSQASAAAVLVTLLLFSVVAATQAESNELQTKNSSNATALANEKAAVDLQGFEDVVERVTPLAGLLFGPVLCFYGYAWYKHIVLVIGFVLGGMLFALGAFLTVESYSSWATLFMIAAFFLGGLLVAAILKQRQAIGTFAIGGGIGIGIAYAAFFFADQPLNNEKNPLLLVSATVLMLLIGALFVHYEKVAVIGFTSVFGAYSWCYGVGHFAGKFPTWQAIYDLAWSPKEDTGTASEIPWVWWVYCTGFVVLVLWSLREQWKRKAKEGESRDVSEMLTLSPSADAMQDRHTSYHRV